MKSCTLPASVLATVLVVCTLMLLGVCVVMTLWDSRLMTGTVFLDSFQKEGYIESGYVMYGADSSLMVRLRADSTVLLFEDMPASRLKISRIPWGWYEVVNISAAGKYYSSSRLMGRKFSGTGGKILYLADHRNYLSVVGRVEINGEIAVPGGRLCYTQVRNEFFCGRKPRPETVTGSTPGLLLPEGNAWGWGSGEMQRLSLTPAVFRRSFREPPVCLSVTCLLPEVDIRGQVVLTNPDSLIVSGDCRLENVILAAPWVCLGKGFRGSVQVFARDSVIVGEEVVLKSGSGLYVKGENPRPYIRLGERSELSGYVIVEGGNCSCDPVAPNYSQAETAVVNGLVYVDGVADVHGVVNGSLVAGECTYFAPEGYYSHMLYSLMLNERKEADYPLYLCGPYERRVLKWLD